MAGCMCTLPFVCIQATLLMHASAALAHPNDLPLVAKRHTAGQPNDIPLVAKQIYRWSF